LVEHIVFFTLGFVICGLIGLAFLPMVSARARRLMLERIEDRLPMSFDEIEADRDLLRARFAVELRAMESRAEAARGDRAADAAELGRRAVAVVRAREAQAESENRLREREAELARAQEAGRKLQSELDAARLELAARQEALELKAEDLRAADEAGRELNLRADELNTALGAAKTRLDEFEDRRKRLLAKIAAERQRGDALDEANRALRHAAEESGAAQGAPVLAIGSDGVAFPLRPPQEMLDLREAIAAIGRDVAAMQASQTQAGRDAAPRA
jgi:chromosome segregation ATPase